MRFDRRDDPKIPHAADLAVLPNLWVDYLTRGRIKDQGVPVDMDSLAEVVNEWALENLPGDKEACNMTKNAASRWVTSIQVADSSSHDKITSAHWEIFKLALEGHHGWQGAILEIEKAWLGDVGSRGKRSRSGAHSECGRSREGALRKIKGHSDDVAKATEVAFVVPECSCFDEMAVQYEGVTPPCAAKSPDEYKATDDGNAEHLHELFGGDLRYVEDSESAGELWAHWSGESWDVNKSAARQCFTAVKNRQEAFVEHLEQIQKELPGGEDHPDFANLSARIKKWLRVAEKSGNAFPARSAIDSFRHRRGVPIRRGAFNLRPELIGVANGMIEFTDDGFALRLATKEDMVTHNTGIPYIPLAEQKNDPQYAEGVRLWEDYLETFLPDLHHFVQKVMGFSLYGENLEKKLVFLLGPGNSGKSTLLEASMAGLGAYAGAFDLKKVFSGKDLNPEMERALQRRIITNTEAGSKDLNSEQIKRLTGGDQITNELKFGNTITEKVPPFVPIVATNQVPTIDGADEPLRGRLMVIPFNRQVDGAENEKNARETIRKECGAAVLAWMLEGWNLYCTEGLDREGWPEAVKEATGDFAAELNPVARFVNESLTPDIGGRVKVSMVQDTYQLWAGEAGSDEKLSARPLVSALKKHGLTMTKNAVRFPDDTRERAFLDVKIAEDCGPGPFRNATHRT